MSKYYGGLNKTQSTNWLITIFAVAFVFWVLNSKQTKV